MRQYYRVMAPGDDERPDRPEYNVYRAGSRGRGRGRRAKQPRGDAPDSAPAKGGPPPPPPGRSAEPPDEGPGYHVYRGGRRSGGGGAALGSLRKRFGGGGGGGGRASGRVATEGGFPWRRVLKWSAIALGAWLLLSLVLFAVSAQIQKGKLDDNAADALNGTLPLMIAQGQTILVIGTDVRPAGVPDEDGNISKQKCVDAAGRGAVHPPDCAAVRADTLMLVRAGRFGSVKKLSIPRDVYADIPGHDPQKINAAYAFGGAGLQIETVENFLGINVDHVVILDFGGFADFIDALGGVTVDLPTRVKSKVDGGSSAGGITLKLDQGENTLTGDQALALARTRKNEWDPSEDDRDRARRQQLILQGIQGRMTSITRLPYNILHAPWIAWNAPKAMVSDMGAWTLPQLAFSVGVGGSSDTEVLKPSGVTADGALIVKPRRCRAAVKDFLGDRGPRRAKCSPDTGVDTALDPSVAPDPAVTP